MSAIRLGLIGDNIAASRAPELHQVSGRLCGLDVTYDRLVPKTLGSNFDEVFDRARDEGYRGLNITYPYKEAVVRRVSREDKSVRLTGACNTVLFEAPGAVGFNTDFTGFRSAFRSTFPSRDAGIVALVGCGGVGRAISVALVHLGARALQLFDTDRSRSEALRDALSGSVRTPEIIIADSIFQACEGADGLVNCTPVGMVGNGGSVFPVALLSGRQWAFDAVYTPVDTPFLQSAVSAGLYVISGYELFFQQGVDAFRIFTGHQVDRAALREALQPGVADNETKSGRPGAA